MSRKSCSMRRWSSVIRFWSRSVAAAPLARPRYSRCTIRPLRQPVGLSNHHYNPDPSRAGWENAERRALVRQLPGEARAVAQHVPSRGPGGPPLSAFSAAHNASLISGTYRPGLCFERAALSRRSGRACFARKLNHMNIGGVTWFRHASHHTRHECSLQLVRL